MPWKALSMSESRAAFVALVRSHTVSFAAACRQFGIARKTGYKWLRRATDQPFQPLVDRSRRPQTSPAQTRSDIEQAVLQLRQQFGWGARKLHALLRRQGLAVPSPRTITAILHRHQQIMPRVSEPPAVQRFERAAANDLWQLDFKGPLAFQRRKLHLFSVLDDHARFALSSDLVADKTMATAWESLWRLFGEVGLPASVLCDNAFAAPGHVGVSWFEARLIRLGVGCLHGRPYHPQTQGKIERWHGTLAAEIFPRLPWDDPVRFAAGLRHWRTTVYNAVRPHEALGDVAPITRWRPSPRRRPDTLPRVEYAAGVRVRKVMQKGEISWRNCEILVGAGLHGEWVRVEEDALGHVGVWYAWKQIRSVPVDQLRRRAIV
jgi:transposase InsO family protein